MSELEKEILEEIKPSLQLREKINKTAVQLKKEIQNIMGSKYKPRVVGSVAKGTYLKDPDIDVFVLFPTSVPKEDMEKKIIEVGEKILSETEQRYAEHPYINGLFKGFKADIVPCYDISNIKNMKSAVDRTPFHTDYIIDNLSDNLKDEVILLKAFLKGIGAYSAESKVWGFSGYLCELLILNYGGFQEVLNASQGWKYGEKIEIVEGENNFEDALIFIDPVDPERNVASALSSKKMYLFMYAAKRYLDDPRKTFFFPNEIKVRDSDTLMDIAEDRGTYFIGLRLPRPNIVEDNLYPQVQKSLRQFCYHLQHLDFEVLHSDYFVNKETLLLIIELESCELPLIEKHIGPPIWVPHTKDFIEKYGKEVYLEENRLMVDKKRDITDVKEALKYIINEVNLGSDLSPIFKGGSEIIELPRLISEHRNNLNYFIDRTFPWER